MWVRWRRYQKVETVRWHWLVEENRTACGYRLHRYDWTEYDEKPPGNQRCLTCLKRR